MIYHSWRYDDLFRRDADVASEHRTRASTGGDQHEIQPVEEYPESGALLNCHVDLLLVQSSNRLYL